MTVSGTSPEAVPDTASVTDSGGARAHTAGVANTGIIFGDVRTEYHQHGVAHSARMYRDAGFAAAIIGTVFVSVLAIVIVAAVRGSLLPHGSGRPQSTDSSPPSTPAATSKALARAETPAASRTTSAGPDGVTYQCTGSAPAGVNITYGPSGSGLQATRLPFTARGRVSTSVNYYRINAQLHGSGHVSCSLTVTDDGRITTSSGTARGGYNTASPQICSDYKDRWQPCG